MANQTGPDGAADGTNLSEQGGTGQHGKRDGATRPSRPARAERQGRHAKGGPSLRGEGSLAEGDSGGANGELS